MVRKEEWSEIKKDPEKYKRYISYRKKYRQKLKQDPIRHAHWKELHRLERLRNYHKPKEKINQKRKEWYGKLSPKEKEEIFKLRKKQRIERRKRVLEQWGNKCQKCEYSEHPEILEFDHKTPLYRKHNNIKKVVSDHMLKEIKDYPERLALPDNSLKS